MPNLLPQSILCSVLIGRDAQVAALARLLEQARAGHGQIALFSGTPRNPFGCNKLQPDTKAKGCDQ